VSEERDKRDKADLEFLLARPEFRRFFWRVIQSAGIFARTTDGSDGRNLAFDEGRRNLGLEILEMAEAAQPAAPSPDIPASTLIQVLLEESQQPTEKPNGRRTSDRYSELADADG
jgi:hypothetical protein